MGLTVTRLETPEKIIVTFKFQLIKNLLLLAAILTASQYMVSLSFAGLFVILTVISIVEKRKVRNELREGLQEGRVKIIGNKWSFKPIVYEISKKQPIQP
jgi:hypothetical protein